jgi:two-component system, NtrC family, response regulator AtoC
VAQIPQRWEFVRYPDILVEPPKFASILPETQTESPAISLPARPHLVMFHKDGVRSVPLRTDRPLIIGRAPECDLHVDTPLLSRAHFAVHFGGQAVTVEDLKSANGTKVAGLRLPAQSPTAIEEGTLIEAGGLFFMVKQRLPQELRSLPPPPRSGASTLPVGVLSGVVVVDPSMARLHELVELVARSSIPVLVVGETGVGKEVISVELHRRSARAAKPLVSLNCAALPETLLESELFGYEKGSFTGATHSKQGLIESADGGTLFLDEIGEMPLSTQAKLLRVLESGELMRLGSTRPRVVDVRFIAATNRNLPSQVSRGIFRRDLYYRLNGITIPVPPLRERPSEIPALATHLLAQAAKRARRPVPQVPQEVLRMLVGHAWPGNIRELRNVMERSLTLCRDEALSLANVMLDADLPEGLDEPAGERLGQVAATMPATTATQTIGAGGASGAIGDKGRLMRMDPGAERGLIVQALEQAGGNQSKAAEILGISRRTLINRLDEYGMKRPRKRTDEE